MDPSLFDSRNIYFLVLAPVYLKAITRTRQQVQRGRARGNHRVVPLVGSNDRRIRYVVKWYLNENSRRTIIVYKVPINDTGSILEVTWKLIVQALRATCEESLLKKSDIREKALTIYRYLIYCYLYIYICYYYLWYYYIYCKIWKFKIMYLYCQLCIYHFIIIFYVIFVILVEYWNYVKSDEE